MNRQLRMFVCVGLLALLVAFTFTGLSRSASTLAAANDKQTAFQDAMRKLWEDHITWTRVFIISAVADLPDKAAATERLLQNQVDIGNAIKPYYGNAAGDKLTTLLKEHITKIGRASCRERVEIRVGEGSSKRSKIQR